MSQSKDSGKSSQGLKTTDDTQEDKKQETDDAHITVYAKKKPQLNQPGNYVKINCGSCTKLIHFDEESSISSCDSDVDYTLLDCTDSQNEMSQQSTLASGEGATKKDDSHTASSSKDKPKFNIRD